MGTRAEQIAAHERRLADSEFEGYCEVYAVLARGIAADAALLERLAALPIDPKVLPVLLFAAVHDLALAEPGLLDLEADPATNDPWPAFRAVTEDRFDELADTMTTRTIQTNEVGRSAPVLTAIVTLHREVERPLHLIEIGASAGLNLLLDRFGFSFPTAEPGPFGVASSPVQLRCEVRGPLAPPVADPPPIAGRVGLDVRPVDITDARERRWLRACVWPGLTERAGNLDAALALARTDPAEVRAGNALDLLDAAIDEVDADAVPCVVSTWVLAYLAKDDRRILHDLLARHGARRDIVAVTGEYEGIAPWIPPLPGRAPRLGDGARSTVLGLTAWIAGRPSASAAARIQAHGRWIEWLHA